MSLRFLSLSISLLSIYPLFVCLLAEEESCKVAAGWEQNADCPHHCVTSPFHSLP